MKTPGSHRIIASYYIVGTLFATAIGAVIFYGVFIGEFNVDNLQPITRDVHIIGNKIFRFNPGANVDEFGEIIGYALLMLPWTGWKNWVKAIVIPGLLIADFLTLTRGAWLALIAAYFVLFLYSPARTRAILGVTAIVGIGSILIVAFTFDVLTPLLQTRTQFSAGVSGDDRLASVNGALDTLLADPFRFFFGMGWAADLYGKDQGLGTSYIHNVPLMMLFDTGLFGILICLVVFAVFFRFIIARPAHDQAIPMALMAFMLTISATQHNFYHVQTWMIFGLILGDSLRAVRDQSRTLTLLAPKTSAI
jgi:O-antigen ligase